MTNGENNCLHPPSISWENVTYLSSCTNDLTKALTAYMIVLILSFCFMFFVFKSYVLQSIIFALIVSQIFINFIFIPTRYNIFSEFCNSNAFYIFIQTISPIVIYIYAFYTTFLSRYKNVQKND